MPEIKGKYTQFEKLLYSTMYKLVKSVSCTPETNVTLCVNYTQTKKKKKKKREREKEKKLL